MRPRQCLSASLKFSLPYLISNQMHQGFEKSLCTFPPLLKALLERFLKGLMLHSA